MVKRLGRYLLLSKIKEPVLRSGNSVYTYFEDQVAVRKYG